jgi:hypothetical protein
MIHHSGVAQTRISPRARRRLVWLAALAVAGGAIVLVFALLPESKGGFDTPRSTGPVQIVKQQKQVPVSAQDRKEINALFDEFVPAAVARRDPGAAYDLVTQTLRAGAPRSQWQTGQIPISPYDAGGTEFHGWTVVTSYPGDLTLDLTLQPRNPKDGPASFSVYLKRVRGRWLVDEFYRRTGYGPATQAHQPKTATVAAPSTHHSSASKGRLGAIWFLVPLSFLALIVLVPTFIFTKGWYDDRRVARKYRGEMSRELPPLPRPPPERERTPGGKT